MEKVELDFHGDKFSIETNRIAKQTAGTAYVRYGDSIVLVTACKGEERDGGFLPLTIDYVEKTYAAGRIPGGYFKREGRLGEKEILTSRLIDRPCRPLFPKGFNYEVQVTATVLSADPEVDTDVLAMVGASTALTISELPFEGPIAAVRVARVNGKLLINPTETEQEDSDLRFIVAGTRDAIVMVEGGADEVPEEEILEALFFAHKEMQPLIDVQEQLREKVGKPKMEFIPVEHDADLVAKITEFASPLLDKVTTVKEKMARKEAYSEAKSAIKAEFIKEDDENADAVAAVVSDTIDKVQSKIVRQRLVKEGVRIDGRDSTTVRPIDIEVGFLPRTHGSSLFTRGETQGIVVATLGTADEAQRIDTLMDPDYTKSFMLHYNFPPFSVGETRPLRGPGRREIGHGALAERAVRAILPSEEEFPYVIRIVSEITESNGSSSMATVCGSSLALMDAGVPLKAPVAGIAMGLIQEGDEFVVLTDILGDEDHLGDMDFKVCGSPTGITALQMDIKIKGLDSEIMTRALNQAKDARLHILDKMNAVIDTHREEVSVHAPKITTMKINPDKIRDVIGQGGKTIRSIQESCGVKISIEEDGTVAIASQAGSKLESAVEIIENLTAEPEIGKIYKGVVKRIADFGAFVEIFPGTDGLVHISQLCEERVKNVRDVLVEGDEVMVKILDVDRQGKIRLSRKEAMAEQEEDATANAE